MFQSLFFWVFFMGILSTSISQNYNLPDEGTLPNIVLILADDMGYGDVQAYNTNSKIPTPNLNRLAKEGMSFTDAHSNSAVCTPTRYGILTGRYSWRTNLKSGVLWPPDDPPLIEGDQLTLPGMLKKYDYHTGAIGKWHLGMEWGKVQNGQVDFNMPIQSGPNEVGFDYFFGIAGSLNMIPYAYYRNHQAVSPITEIQPKLPFPKTIDGGPKAQGFDLYKVLDRLTEEAVGFIKEHANDKNPFFLYFPLTSPHLPILNPERFENRTGLGQYADFILQTDWSVGQILNTLKEIGLEENTLLIYTSDNGSYMYQMDGNGPDHLENPEIRGYHSHVHQANYHWRGTKADIWEAGHRVPLILRWPGKVNQGTKSLNPVCLTDLMATIAEIVGHTLAEDEAEDSYSLLPLLKELNSEFQRPPIVHHSINGTFALRDGPWKMVFGNGSGGREPPTGEPFKKPYALFNLEIDPTETSNVIQQFPDIARQMSEQLKKLLVNK
ncbi:MAG: arylsulfatase [Cyclobacteriaceae bacterium]